MNLKIDFMLDERFAVRVSFIRIRNHLWWLRSKFALLKCKSKIRVQVFLGGITGKQLYRVTQFTNQQIFLQHLVGLFELKGVKRKICHIFYVHRLAAQSFIKRVSCKTFRAPRGGFP